MKDTVVFLVIADKVYPQKLAFSYLYDIMNMFNDELQKRYGTGSGFDYSSAVETIDTPFSF
jgi:hypothetical protein